MARMASQRDVAQETNTRFWIGTQHKLGEALDPNDPADRRHTKIWLDIYRELRQQNARGTLTLTHKHPSVAQSLSDAINAYRVERVTREGDPRYAEARRVKHQALNDAVLWQEMVMSRGTTAVSGSGDVSKAESKARWLVPAALAAALGIAYFGYARPMDGRRAR